MAVTIRLTRLGKKHKPYYRIVVLDKRKKRDGAYIEQVGSYDPNLTKDQVKLNDERFDFWRARGAEISDGMRKILKFRKKTA